MNFEQFKNQVNPDLVEKAKACKTNEELTTLLKAEKVELNIDQLEGISGGYHHGPKHCDGFGDQFW